MTSVNVSFGGRKSASYPAPHNLAEKTAATKAKRNQDAEAEKQSRLKQQASMVGGHGAGPQISLKELKRRVAKEQGGSSATPKFSGWA